MALPVKDFVIERLLEYDSSFDVGGGISTTALMINPLSVILQPLRNEIDEVKANQSVLSVREASDPDEYNEEFVDALASNVYLTRRTGNKSSGTVRARFFSPQSLDIGTGLATFLDSAGSIYINVNAVSITSSEMSLNIESSLYYVDIPVESEEEGTAGNIESGGIQSWENEPANVANVTNLNRFSGGTDRETNTQLLDRIEEAVTVRMLVTGRGINTTLTDTFSSISEINSRGFGDPEMQRDIVYNTHVGGHVDIWVKTPALTETYTDILSLVPDTTRRVAVESSVILSEAYPVTYNLRYSRIDDTDVTPVVKSADNLMTFTEGTDYNLNKSLGTIGRISSGSIYHETGTGATVTATKTITTTGDPWISVRSGMRLKITSPSSVAGNYSVKTRVNSNELTIFGEFPATSFPVSSVEWEIDDIVFASYEHNPLSVDVIKTVRSTARTNFTITNVPVIKVKSIEVLDPSTLEPTGTVLNSTGGGFGSGAFGSGSYGSGEGSDYSFKVLIPNLRFSRDEDCYIDIARGYTGYSLRITYDYAPEIATYQDFVEDNQNRPQPAKSIVKHFIPVIVNTGVAINYYVDASNSAAKSAAEVQSDVEAFIEGTAIGNNLELADIVDLLYSDGASRVDLNFTLRGEVHNTNGAIEWATSTSAGILEIPERTYTVELPDTDNPLTKQIAHFIAGTITLNRTVQ